MKYVIRFTSHDSGGNFKVYLSSFCETDLAGLPHSLHCRLHSDKAKKFRSEKSALRLLDRIRKVGCTSLWTIDDKGEVVEC